MDGSVEIVLPYEKDACIAPIISKEKLQVAVQGKKIADQTINIEVCKKTAGVKMLRTELHKRTLTIKRRQEFHSRPTLLESFIEEQKLHLKSCKGKVKMTQEEHAKCKINLETYRVQRGKPEASILMEVEQLLESFKISSTAYHGGKFNGVCCRRLFANAKVVTDEVRGILLCKKDESCETDEIQSKIDALEA